jgi:hypothetical protein
MGVFLATTRSIPWPEIPERAGERSLLSLLTVFTVLAFLFSGFGHPVYMQ